MSSPSRHSSPAASVGITNHVIANQPPASKAERTANARKAFLSSFQDAAKDVDAGLQMRATTISENAQSLIKQEKDLEKLTAQMAKENAEAEKWLEKARKKLDEFADLDNLAAGLDDDLADVEAMLDIMEEKQKAGKYDKKPK